MATEKLCAFPECTRRHDDIELQVPNPEREAVATISLCWHLSFLPKSAVPSVPGPSIPPLISFLHGSARFGTSLAYLGLIAEINLPEGKPGERAKQQREQASGQARIF